MLTSVRKITAFAGGAVTPRSSPTSSDTVGHCANDPQWAHFYLKIYLRIYFSPVHTMTMYIKLWQQHWHVIFPKSLTPRRDSNLDLLFCKWTRWPLSHSGPLCKKSTMPPPNLTFTYVMVSHYWSQSYIRLLKSQLQDPQRCIRREIFSKKKKICARLFAVW
jgi:hypothetical protein